MILRLSCALEGYINLVPGVLFLLQKFESVILILYSKE